MTGIEHGGALDLAIARHGGERGQWLDLSTGINPRPWPVPELAESDWTRLPDRSAEDGLLAAAAALYGVSSRDAVVAAPGTQALIQLLPRLLPAGPAAIVTPETGTYGEHRQCAAAAGRETTAVRMPAEVPADAMLAVLVHPGNPGGEIADRGAVLDLAQAMAARGGYVIADEAFCDCMPEMSFVPVLVDNIIVLRSFGKFFGLAGIRLGFAVCRAGLAETIRDALGPWAVSGPALAAGTRAMADRAWIEETRERLPVLSARLAGVLTQAGLEIAGINPLFVLVRSSRAEAIYTALAEMRVLVRRFAGRPDLLRFGLPAGAGEMERLADALAEAATEGG